MPDQRRHAVPEDDGEGGGRGRDVPGGTARLGHGVELGAPVHEAEQKQACGKHGRHVDVAQHEEQRGGEAERDGGRPCAVLSAGEAAGREQQADGRAHDEPTDGSLSGAFGDERCLQSAGDTAPRTGGRGDDAKTPEHGGGGSNQSRRARDVRRGPVCRRNRRVPVRRLAASPRCLRPPHGHASWSSLPGRGRDDTGDRHCFSRAAPPLTVNAAPMRQKRISTITRSCRPSQAFARARPPPTLSGATR